MLKNVTVTGNSEAAMLIPSVTKYNDVYMPDVEILEMPHRMSNITYYVQDSTFSSNSKCSYSRRVSLCTDTATWESKGLVYTVLVLVGRALQLQHGCLRHKHMLNL